MERVLTPDEMAAADARTIAAGTPVAVLIERAGTAVAWAVRRRLRGLYGRRAVVVCGKGNNGSDGLVTARVLEGWGARVAVFSLADGIDAAEFDRAVARADVAVDAMYGTGFRGTLTGDAARVVDRFTEQGLPVIAVDIPSGVDGLTGAVQGPAVRAVETVTFAARKPGLCFEPGRDLAGVVTVADIGIDLGFDAVPEPGRDRGAPPTLGLVTAADVAAWLPARPPAAHKWQAAVLVVGGSGGMTGAPMLAARAAMRAGAGMVWCAVPGDAAATEAAGGEVITRALPADAAGALTDAAAGEVTALLERFGALVLGPGLGRAAGTAPAVRRILAEATVPVVLDADGLNALAGDRGVLLGRAAPTIVTPHAGEYARLLGEPTGLDRVDAARRLAAATGAVALLKGPGTVVAAPGGRAVINPTGGAELATAGTGDVLSGIVGAFLARGVEPFEAAAAAAFVHGAAARLVAGDAGHTGLVAGDLVEALPAVLSI